MCAYNRVNGQPQLAIVADSGASVVEPGEFSVTVGGKQPGFTGRADAATTSVVEGASE